MSGKEKERKDKSTTKEEHSLGGGSMMDNISRMIPTISDKTSEGRDSEEGGDW